MLWNSILTISSSSCIGSFFTLVAFFYYLCKTKEHHAQITSSIFKSVGFGISSLDPILSHDLILSRSDICTLKIFTNDIHDLATVIMDTRLPHLSSFFGGQTKNDLFPILDNNV